MPLFGCHTSIKGGLYRALTEAHALGCETVQLFSKVAAQWKARELADTEITQFRQTLKSTGLRFPMVHDSYLINLGAADPAAYSKSLDAFWIELQRAEAIGASYLVTHPGAHLNAPMDDALKRVAAAFDDIHQRSPGYQCKILIETTAGQGSALGYRFEQIGRLFALVKQPERLGVCFDTCHAFAAGYALAPQTAYEQTFAEFDRLVGLNRLLAFHINDSQKPLGSRVDRHAHIGRGEMGLEPFRLLVNDPRFAHHPMVLETPKEDDSDADANWDAVNLATLRGLLVKK